LARDLIASKSFRTVVGAGEQNGAPPVGVFLLDTNDSVNYYGLFLLYNGRPETASFAAEHLRKKFSVYSDVFKRGEIPKPKTFLKELLADLLRGMANAGLQHEGESFAAVLVKEGSAVIGRLNGCPVYFLRDHKFRGIFPAIGAGENKLEVESVAIADGDKILLSSQEMVRRLTKQELRSIISTKADLDQACSKITELANRYEEIQTPRLVLIGFERKHLKNKALLSPRNTIVLAGIAIFFLSIIFRLEITNFVILKISNPLRQMMRRASKDDANKAGPGSPLYEFELVSDKFFIPYDLAIGPNNILYVVDDKYTQVVRYDQSAKPDNRKPTLIGGGLNLQFPTGIEIVGNNLFVADSSNTSNKLYIISAKGQKLLEISSIAAPGVGSLIGPKALAVDAGNNIWLADRGSQRLLQFGPDGAYKDQISFKAKASKFKPPNGIAYSKKDDLLYVTFKDTNSIATVSGGANGARSISAFTVTNPNSKSGGAIDFKQPSGIAVDARGFVYIADRANFRIVVADPQGKLVTILDKKKNKDFNPYMPIGLKIDPSGEYLYITGSTGTNYGDQCKFDPGECKGKIWRVKIE
jgi:DNA-binding beta-propeller fold protein YncE